MDGEKDTIVCRCSDVTLARVRELIDEGYESFEEIKRLSRVGMGPCQGKTCQQLVLRELSLRTGKPVRELAGQTSRPPVSGVTLAAVAREAKRHEE
ncbi:MAG: sn-glycerol-3-phosphate dehydrogenase subunit A [Firmicutes bacterium ADurb.Bin248]|nr:MAG: sn-glycerol-3-phosphate dehydrogenase subunit A [Firmicutes bacterium ADurb.Bin248]HOF99585.1 (2Fe-2S)-binding protein [Clostridia bacterium]HPK14541.1 (2Fe-2S)-binding protein [Clostridia bacterium]